MAPSNVLSMAQLRTLPLADQIKILMKNGEWAALPWGAPAFLGKWSRDRLMDPGVRPKAFGKCTEAGDGPQVPVSLGRPLAFLGCVYL